VSFLVDTNVIFELRKGSRCNSGVSTWFRQQSGDPVYLSVLVVGEIRRGIESLRRRDPIAAGALDGWLTKLSIEYAERILPVDATVAELWGRLNVPDTLPAVDSLLAATALVHGMTLVTRNLRDFERCGCALLNPFT
jgi:predicted nucleic acid-binding protein